MTEDLSTAQRLQMAAMFTDALSNLIERSGHLCHHSGNIENEEHKNHMKLLRQTVELTAATVTETIQALVPATKVESIVPEDAAPAGYVNATAARLGE